MTSHIYAVLVLYRLALADSAAWQSLEALAQAFPADRLPGLLVFDNSPLPQDIGTPAVPMEYLSDTTNPGLHAAYSEALRRAAQGKFQWLLLLDQDTILTADYWSELMETLPSLPDSVAAVVPRLTEHGLTHSPTALPRLHHRAVKTLGLLPVPVTAYNSAAVLRVSALQAADGFDARFPLEYADHALFARLRQTDCKVWLLTAKLPHTLSTMQPAQTISTTRYAAMLRAERRYHTLFSTAHQKAWYRVRKLKEVLGKAAKPGGVRLALLEVRALLGLL